MRFAFSQNSEPDDNEQDGKDKDDDEGDDQDRQHFVFLIEQTDSYAEGVRLSRWHVHLIFIEAHCER